MPEPGDSHEYEADFDAWQRIAALEAALEAANAEAERCRAGWRKKLRREYTVHLRDSVFAWKCDECRVRVDPDGKALDGDHAPDCPTNDPRQV